MLLRWIETVVSKLTSVVADVVEWKRIVDESRSGAERSRYWTP